MRSRVMNGKWVRYFSVQLRFGKISLCRTALSQVPWKLESSLIGFQIAVMTVVLGLSLFDGMDDVEVENLSLGLRVELEIHASRTSGFL